MDKEADHEKVTKSTLCFKIFTEIVKNRNNTYGKLVESMGISKQTIGEGLGYLEEQKLIQKISPPENKDKRLIQLVPSEIGFRTFYENWVKQNYTSEQLAERIKRTKFLEALSDQLMHFFKVVCDRPGVITFGHLFVLYENLRPSDETLNRLKKLTKSFESPKPHHLKK